MAKPSLKQFYESEYRSDPLLLLSDAYSDICSWASSYGITLSDIFNDIQLPSKGEEDKFTKYESYAAMDKALPANLKGRATLISHERETKNGLRYPYLALLIKGSIDDTWNGYQFLQSRYETSYLHLMSANEQGRINQEQQKRKQERLKQMQKTAEEKRIKGLLNSQKRDQTVQFFINYHREFNQALAEMGNGTYFQRKKIADITTLSNVKRMVGRHNVGDHTAIPFTKLEGIAAGKVIAWQRVLDKPLSSGENKLTTRVLNQNDLSGAMHIFGQLVNGQRIIVGEGYATVASGMLAKNADAGVMAYSASNMKTVVDVLRRQYPESELFILVDNDHKTCAKGEGNPGILAAIDILVRHDASGKVKAYVPTFEDMSKDNRQQSSDFNDLHVYLGLDYCSKQIGAKANRIDWHLSGLDKQLFTLRYTKNKDLKRQVKRCVLSGMAFVPAVMSSEDLFNAIHNELKRLHARRNSLKFTELVKHLHTQVERINFAASARAMSFRSFSSRITNKNHRPEHVNYKQFNQWQIDDEIVDYIRQCQGPVIIRAGMGSRKSSKALRELFREAESGLLTAHRQSLIGDLFGTMAKRKNYDNLGEDNDVLHYQDLGASTMAPYANKLVVCVNSIIKGIFRPLVKSHDFFGMDEATQTLRSVLTGGAMAYPVQVYDILKTAIATSRNKVVLADADANDHLITLLERANERRVELGLPSWEKINVIDLPVNVEVEQENGNRSKIRIDHTDPNHCFVEITRAIEKGERSLIATDSTKFAKQVKEMVEYMNERDRKGKKPLKVLYVSQDTKPEVAVREFQDNPERIAKRYDVLIYSPAISSGVSINIRHFVRHFGVFYGEIVPSDAIQMLRRDRKATQFTLGLGTMGTRRETNLLRMVRGFIEAQNSSTQCSVNMKTGEFTLGTHDTEFNRARMEMMVEENKARNDFSNQMLRILDTDGYNVNRMATSQTLSELGQKNRKALQGYIEERELDIHMNKATTPDEERLEALKSQQTLSEIERAELNRWDIEKVLCDEVTPISYEFHKTGGMKKAARFELLQMSQEQADEFDRLEARTEFTYQIQSPVEPHPVTWSVKADSEQESKHLLHRAFCSIRVINIEQEGDLFTFTLNSNGTEITKEISAKSKQEAEYCIFEQYFECQVLKQSQAPVVEISKRQYLGINRRTLVDYLRTCGIDPVTGEGKASQEGMRDAMAALVATESQQDVFNNVATLWGGRIEQGQRKRPTDMFKLVCEQLGSEAEKANRTRTEGRKVFWTIDQVSWKEMATRNDRRNKAHVTSFNAAALENTSLPVIHDLLSNYKDHEEVVDHAEGQKEMPFNQLITTAAKLVQVPLDWASGLFDEDEQSAFTSGKLTLKHLCMALRDIFMADNGHTLSAGEFERLRNWQLASV